MMLSMRSNHEIYSDNNHHDDNHNLNHNHNKYHNDNNNDDDDNNKSSVLQGLRLFRLTIYLFNVMLLEETVW